jgi:aryl-phospho-beta-D-glucosidase BglC (GH1 family)
MLKVLGEEKYSYFFDKFLEYFFTESDAKAFASLGLNAIRLPINYRHLEDDMNPRVFKKEGLKHLDRVIELVSGLWPFFVSFSCDLHADIIPQTKTKRTSSTTIRTGKKQIQCAKHGIYTIIDLHAAPGAQNTDWHSDLGESIFTCYPS